MCTVQGCDVLARVVNVHFALSKVVMCQQGATHPLSLALLGPKVNIDGIVPMLNSQRITVLSQQPCQNDL